jgi:hypothetical protein
MNLTAVRCAMRSPEPLDASPARTCCATSHIPHDHRRVNDCRASVNEAQIGLGVSLNSPLTASARTATQMQRAESP